MHTQKISARTLRSIDISYGKKLLSPLYPFKDIAHVCMALAYDVLFGPLPQPEHIVFIVGCSRSGTTIFEKVLSMHDELAGYSEGQFVWDILDRKIDHDHYKDESDVTWWQRHKLQKFFAYIHTKSNSHWVMNKNPQNSVRLRFINAIFPTSKFIHIVRDGRAVIDSMQQRIEKEPFRQRYPYGRFCKPKDWRDHLHLEPSLRYAMQWKNILEEVRNALDMIGKDRYLEINYENLCAYPIIEMKKVCEFLNIELTEAFARVCADSFDSPRGNWRSRVKAQELSAMEEIMRPLLVHYGYIPTE